LKLKLFDRQEQVKHPAGGAGDVVIADKIHAPRSAVVGAVRPVVDDVIANIEIAIKLVPAMLQASGQAPVSPGAVGQQIVMKASNVAGDRASEAVALAGPDIMRMDRHVQRLSDDRALKRDIVRAAGAERFVDAPGNRAMIDDAVVAASKSASVHGDARF